MEEALATLLDPAKATTEAEFKAAWERCLQQAPKTKPLTIREARRTKAPRVGTVTERSSVANQRKREALMETPPPPTPRRQKPPGKPPASNKATKNKLTELFGSLSDIEEDEAAPNTEAPTQTTEPIQTEHGPHEPPAIKVHIDGHDIEVPYFAATVTRKYKARVGIHRYVIRFDYNGQCGFMRKLPK